MKNILIKIERVKPKRYRVATKTLDKLANENPDIIDQWHHEGEDGYWVYLKRGYINPLTETHCIHELTVKDVLLALKAVEKCDCEQCKGAIMKELMKLIDDNNGKLLWRALNEDGSVKVSAYTINGKILLVQVSENRRGDFEGFDVFMPVSESNTVNVTLTAVREYLGIS